MTPAIPESAIPESDAARFVRELPLRTDDDLAAALDYLADHDPSAAQRRYVEAIKAEQARRTEEIDAVLRAEAEEEEEEARRASANLGHDEEDARRAEDAEDVLDAALDLIAGLGVGAEVLGQDAHRLARDLDYLDELAGEVGALDLPPALRADLEAVVDELAGVRQALR